MDALLLRKNRGLDCGNPAPRGMNGRDYAGGMSIGSCGNASILATRF